MTIFFAHNLLANLLYSISTTNVSHLFTNARMPWLAVRFKTNMNNYIVDEMLDQVVLHSVAQNLNTCANRNDCIIVNVS